LKSWCTFGHAAPARNFVDSEYFSALRIPLLQGRLWDKSENDRGAAVAVINQSLARQYFSHWQRHRSPEFGHPIFRSGAATKNEETVGVPETNGWLQIIGVVGDSMNDGLDRPVQPALYMPYTRSYGCPPSFSSAPRDRHWPPYMTCASLSQSVNSDQQAAREVRDLQGRIEAQPEWQQHRMFSILFAFFSSLALTLALIGLYSVISYTVAQRTNEFGIRMALGARRGHVLWIVARSVGITVGGGLTVGILITLASQKFMARWMETAHTTRSFWRPSLCSSCLVRLAPAFSPHYVRHRSIRCRLYVMSNPEAVGFFHR